MKKVIIPTALLVVFSGCVIGASQLVNNTPAEENIIEVSDIPQLEPISLGLREALTTEELDTTNTDEEIQFVTVLGFDTLFPVYDNVIDEENNSEIPKDTEVVTKEPANNNTVTSKNEPNNNQVASGNINQQPNQPQQLNQTPNGGIDVVYNPTTEVPTTEAPKTEAPKTEAPKTETPTTEAPKTETPKAEATTEEEMIEEYYTTERQKEKVWVISQEAYTEYVYERRYYDICNNCGADITNNVDAHLKTSVTSGGQCGSFHGECEDVIVGSIEHPEEGYWEWR